MSSRASVGTSIILLMLTTLLAAGCGSDGEGPEPGMGQVPVPLLDVEGQAEDAYDRALVADLAGVRATADAIATGWQGFRAQASAAGAVTADLQAMDAAASGLVSVAAASTDPATVARAANAISAPMDELFALYDPVVPAPVLELDYLGREVVLDSMQLELSAASLHVETIADRWDLLRPAVVDAGGAAEAAAYDASIAALRAHVAAADGPALGTEAGAGLEIVDMIEAVFEP